MAMAVVMSELEHGKKTHVTFNNAHTAISDTNDDDDNGGCPTQDSRVVWGAWGLILHV